MVSVLVSVADTLAPKPALLMQLELEARVGIEQELVLSVATPRSTTTLAITGPSPDRQRNRP